MTHEGIFLTKEVRRGGREKKKKLAWFHARDILFIS